MALMQVSVFLSAGLVSFFCLLITIVVYRLHFHPLAKFPGPKLAAATKWYEFYFDCLKGDGGQFAFEIDKMHERYGSIVRINPDELHIKDVGFYSAFYSGSTEVRDKYPPAAAMAGQPLGSTGTVSHELHRLRRQALNPLFAKGSIRAAEPQIIRHVDRLITKFEADIVSNRPLSLFTVLLAFTTDVLYDFIFHIELGMLDDDERAADWTRTLDALVQMTTFVKQFPWLVTLMRTLPNSWLESIDPDTAGIMKLEQDIHRRTTDVVQCFNRSDQISKQDSNYQAPDLITHLLSSSLPEQEKSIERLAQESFNVTGAGSETTARTLSNALYHLTSNPSIQAAVRTELRTVMPHHNSSISACSTLEALPLLSAVVKETLRVSPLISSRLPLVIRTPLQYQSWTIPAGAVVGMTIQKTLNDASVFPDPKTFDPYRWLQSTPEQLEAMNRAYVPFSRGTRGCVGINLAYAEIYIVLAAVVRRFDLELYDTIKERDVDFARDCFIALPTKGSKGIRVLVREAKD